MNCPACQTEIAPGMTYCPTCRSRGAPPVAQPVLTPIAKPVAPPPASEPGTDKNERLFLYIACLVAAGALAIPRLRRSRAFGPTGKLLLGIGAAVNTTAAVALILFLVIKGPDLLMDYVRYLQRR